MENVKVYINNIKTMVEVATGYGKYFRNIHFLNKMEFNKARDYAYKAYFAFVKSTELIDEAHVYTNKLTEIIEYNDPETFYGYEDTDYDTREDISAYEMATF